MIKECEIHRKRRAGVNKTLSALHLHLTCNLVCFIAHSSECVNYELLWSPLFGYHSGLPHRLYSPLSLFLMQFLIEP